MSTGGPGGRNGEDAPVPYDENAFTRPERAMDRDGDDEKHLGMEKILDYDVTTEESTSSHLDSDWEKQMAQRDQTRLARHQSNFTTATATSVATSFPPDEEDVEPKKRTWSQRLNPLKRKTPPPVPDARRPTPDQYANFFSKLTFQWISPLMGVGYQRPLELNDIYEVHPRRRIDVLKAKLLDNFETRKRKQRKGKDKFSPLSMALYDTFKKEFWIGGLCQLTGAILQVMAPFTMKYLITFALDSWLYINFKYGKQPPIAEGIGYVLGITAMQFIQSFCINHFIYNGMLMGGESRSVLTSVIFEKSMKLSGRARAGGKAPGTEEQKPDFKPGSKEEKAYYKAQLADLQKDDASAQGWGNGRIVNLMSTDTYRIDQACGMGHMMWTSPIQICLTLALLLINLKYSALAGIGVLVVLMPLLARAVKSLMARRRHINKITDQRVSLTQEIVQAVRFVKFFGWEEAFLKRLAQIRASEIGKIAVLLSIRNAIMAVSMSLPIFASMLAFITYKLSIHPLNPAPIFSSLALFNSLRIPLNLLPLVLGQVVDALNSVVRIEEFLNAEEAQDDTVWQHEARDAIVVENGSFTWERSTKQAEGEKASNADPESYKEMKQQQKAAKSKAKQQMDQRIKQLKLEKEQEKNGTGLSYKNEHEITALPQSPTDTVRPDEFEGEEQRPFEIRDINLSIARDELIAVIGSVGSGKSSLLAALAGDMRKTDGNVTFGANRAFCPQYAWIQNTTVRDNITFGREYHRRWYNEVVDACALRPDLEMLPAGDQTEIGERGITVSGGQKQRLNIARAIYFNADVVIMDDPLSAVDAHVGRHIMDKAICGLLAGKARVLATHQLHVLHRVDRIVWMKEGAIYKVSSFKELMADDAEFQKLMETTSAEEAREAAQQTNEDGVETDKKDAKKKKKRKQAIALMQQEDRAVDGIGWPVYRAYIECAGSIWVAPLVLVLLAVSQGTSIMTSLWLSYWVSNKYPYLSTGQYVGIYAGLGVLQAILTFAFSTSLAYYGTRASRVMLNRALHKVLRAPMSFFDTTPLGRITNRFSKDVDILDNTISDSMRMFFLTMAMILSVFCLIISYYHIFVVALVPLIVCFLLAASYYRASARELKRHEAVMRSSMFARFTEAIQGQSTIRAYGVENQFARKVHDAIDHMDGAYFLTFANQRWLSVRLDSLGNILVFVVGILVVTNRVSVNPSIGGLVLSYILSIVQMIQFTVRQLAEVENNMNSTERLHYYGTKLDEEAPLHLGQTPENWPEKGEIVFDNVQMRYREGLPLVLKGLDMKVRAGERIGVVGRTGAGKSTIMQTLFRLTELSGGSITIDGVDISTIGLHDLRSKLAIIPQDPTLFKGTIRSNLDPFNEHDDLKLWHALRQADLVGAEQTMDDEGGRVHLDTKVEDEGLNFSLGQRQLLALARALVRGSQIIVCDEATSSVDFETDLKIQKTIVRGFEGKTLLCIAHRLRTIIHYDRILVMDAGNVAELDSPLNLYDRGGIFRSMCERSGIRRSDFFDTEGHSSDGVSFVERRQERMSVQSAPRARQSAYQGDVDASFMAFMEGRRREEEEEQQEEVEEMIEDEDWEKREKTRDERS